MAGDTNIVNTQAAADQSQSSSLGRTVTQQRKPEGEFQLFVMDFASGSMGPQHYPAILKPLGKGRTAAVKYKKDDYLPFRYAVGRARDYILKAFGIQGFKNLDALPIKFIREGQYYRLFTGAVDNASQSNPYANWNPEERAVIIKRGKPHRVQPAGYITQTGINDQNIGIKGPVVLRTPTIVTAFHFYTWLCESPAVTERTKLESMILGGGKKVPIAGGGVQITSNVDG